MMNESTRIDELQVKLSAPARRALEGADIVTLADLAKWREKDVLALHGMGPASMPTLRSALAQAGLSFASHQ